jgi:hypothetical protein
VHTSFSLNYPKFHKKKLFKVKGCQTTKKHLTKSVPQSSLVKKTKAQINMALHMEEKKRELLAERKREGRESSKNDHLLI